MRFPCSKRHPGSARWFLRVECGMPGPKQPLETFRVLLQTSERVPPNDINTTKGPPNRSQRPGRGVQIPLRQLGFDGPDGNPRAGYGPLAVPSIVPLRATEIGNSKKKLEPRSRMVRAHARDRPVYATVVLGTEKNGAFMKVGPLNSPPPGEPRAARAGRMPRGGFCEPKRASANVRRPCVPVSHP